MVGKEKYLVMLKEFTLTNGEDNFINSFKLIKLFFDTEFNNVDYIEMNFAEKFIEKTKIDVITFGFLTSVKYGTTYECFMKRLTYVITNVNKNISLHKISPYLIKKLSSTTTETKVALPKKDTRSSLLIRLISTIKTFDTVPIYRDPILAVIDKFAPSMSIVSCDTTQAYKRVATLLMLNEHETNFLLDPNYGVGRQGFINRVEYLCSNTIEEALVLNKKMFSSEDGKSFLTSNANKELLKKIAIVAFKQPAYIIKSSFMIMGDSYLYLTGLETNLKNNVLLEYYNLHQREYSFLTNDVKYTKSAMGLSNRISAVITNRCINKRYLTADLIKVYSDTGSCNDKGFKDRFHGISWEGY